MTGNPEAMSAWRACFMKRSGNLDDGGRSAPPLKPASHSWYFHWVRLMVLVPGVEALEIALLA